MTSYIKNAGLIKIKYAIIWFTLFLTACNQNSDPENLSTSNTPPIVKVISSGGFAAAYDGLIDRIEMELGIQLETEYGSSSGGAIDSIPVRLENGDNFDVIILSRESLDNLTLKGFVTGDSRVDLVRSRIGMAVKEGSPIPAINDVTSFIQVLKDAQSIAYSASASGTYLSTELFPALGIWEWIEPKSTRVLSERVAAVVARGDAEIGFQQISEILPITGATFVGPIPDELQKVTTFSAGILVNATNPVDASRLLDYLASEELAAEIEASGLSPVVLEKANEAE